MKQTRARVSSQFCYPSFDTSHDISQVADITPKQAYAVMEAMGKVMKEAILHKEPIYIRGLGSFIPVWQKPFMGRSPKRPEGWPAGGKYRVKFRIGKELKYMMNHEDPSDDN